MLCQGYYKDGIGRLSVPPGRYFRMLFVGQFEGLDSEREIAWRCADSLSLHRFLKLTEGETAPDPSTLSVTRSRLPLEVHHAVFGLLLEIADKHTLVRGKRIGVDASTQEANAALRRLVRRDTGEDYQEMLRRLARESGLETPTTEDLIRFDRTRQNKTLSNADWASPTDPAARHRPDEGRHHAPRLQTGARRRSRHRRDRGGPDPSGRSGRHRHADRDAGTGHARSGRSRADPGEPGRDDRRHGLSFAREGTGGQRLEEPYLREGAEGFCPLARRRHGSSVQQPGAAQEARQAFKLRAEKVERSFALILDIGGLRRTWLRGAGNVEKRYLIQVAAHNLGLVIRHRFGAGTPRQAVAVLWFVLPEPCPMTLAIWAILLPLEVDDDYTIPPWKVVAFGCLITST
jgi:transposase